jgi:DNA polymerase-3 subunit alpha
LLIKEKELLGFFLTGHPMDAYKEVLKQLSIVSLHEIEGMDHDTVFRAAFILETLQVRISNKSQRKFAICTISDGALRFEMSIWSDLYEEKSYLLKENQLLYAVLQVDKREENLRINCKWLEDLTQVNIETIQACDDAYDKAKLHASRPFIIKEKNPVQKIEPVKKIEPITISINLKEARLSHILTLKSLFRSNVGPTPVLVNFQREGKKVATLTIDRAWGVNNSDEFKKQLHTFPFVSIL